MMKSSPRYLSGAALCVCLWHNPAPAQLSHNLSIGNPVALSMANSATAYIRGPDAIHYNPAALALVETKYEQYKLQMGFFDYEGTVSGAAPGRTFDPLSNADYLDDPLLQGEQSRDVSVESPSVYLPFFGHTPLPFLVAPGYGFALRGGTHDQFVFANSAFAVQIFGYERDMDNIAAFNGQRFGITAGEGGTPEESASREVAMQTADNNILHVPFVVHYRIQDAFTARYGCAVVEGG